MSLHLLSFVLGANAYMNYGFLRNVVTKIEYDPVDHLIYVTQQSGLLFQKNVIKFEPEDLVKCKS